MARKNDPKDEVQVRQIPSRKGVTVGKPTKIVTSAMRSKVAFPAMGGSEMGMGGSFYSPELSTDFLELPQSDDEKRNFYRFFYNYDPFVGQAIDLLDELPLSKVRLRKPPAKNLKIADAATRFCEKWAERIGLLQKLLRISHEWNLLGEAFIFCEDTSPDMPQDVQYEIVREVTADGQIAEKVTRLPDADDRAAAWMRKNYKGWSAVRVLPPEQILMESFPFTEERLIELIPDSKTKAVINRAEQGDPHAARVVRAMPQDVVAAIMEGRNIPLNTDPDAGSFVYYMARTKSDYDPRGQSILGRCLLPGTPIWIDRSGIVQEVPVEQVNDQTDFLLTHKGRFMPCKAGSRPVDEDIVALTIEGLEKPLRLTANHEVLRVTETGDTEWVEASQLREGDLVREGHVVPEGDNWLRQIDLAAWWKGRVLQTVKRGRVALGLPDEGRQVTVSMVTSEADSGLAVTFTYENDNRNRVAAIPELGRLLHWANGLQEPVVRTQAEVAAETGLSVRDVRVYAPRLRKEGLLRTESRSLGRGKGRQVTWFPSLGIIPPVYAQLGSPVTMIPVTEDFCYLLGTWLGDGCLWTDTNFLNVHSVGWSLQDAEPGIQAKIRALIATCFPKSTVIDGALIGKGFEETGSAPIRIEDSLLGRWLQEEFGHTAQGKHLPEWVLYLPEGHVRALLQGLLDTDGCLRVGKASMVEFTLDNPLLIAQMHLLCNRLGFKTQRRWAHKRAHSWTRRWQTKTGWREKTYEYAAKDFPKLVCCNQSDVQDWAQGSVKGDRVDWPDRHHAWKSKFEGDWLTRKVIAVQRTPYAGQVFSFAVSQDESHVTHDIVTHNCLRTLIFRDKVRQSLTSIASRHMTPCRVIYAEDMNAEQTEALREQVDMVLQDPDFSIICNYAVTWEEMGADQRLPDWSWVFEHTNQLMYAGLGMTESLLSGETSYSGDRLHLEVINTRFMLMRETLQELVQNYFFRPMCARMGFVEEDEDGNLEVLVPQLSFTRLALRDNNETFDALFNLYTKGSLDIGTILDLLNLDSEAVKDRLQQDFATLKDATFNEVLRGMYTAVGQALGENSDVAVLIAERLGLKYEKPKEEGASRF